MAGVPGPVVERWNVPGDAPIPALRRGDRVGRSHVERVEDPGSDELPPRAPRNGFEDHAEGLVAGVGVVEPCSRGEAELRFAEGPQLVHALAGEVSAGRQSRGVRQEVVKGDRRRRRWDIEP
jgi:hypothetical protein